MALDQETLNQFVDSVRRYVRDRLVPLEMQVAEEDRIPDDVIDELKELGLFGLSIPEEFGGLGLNMAEEAAIIQEMGYTSPVFRSMFGTNVGIGSQGIIIDGTAEQKARYLPKLATGELIGSFALTEADAGSDAGSVMTSARREGDDYIINGAKRYITNAPRAGVFTVMARTGRKEDGGRGVSAFLVDADLPGISLGKPDKKMGQKGAHTCDVMFDNVRVPASALIGGVEGQGFKTAMKVLDRGRLHISALSVGTAKRLIDESLAYSSQRKQFGTEIANFQLVQAMLADSQTEYYAGKCMVEETARSYDAGQPVSMNAASCKLFCTEMVGRVADRAVQIHGGAGYISEYCVERFYRDVRLFRLYEGTSQIQQLVIAKQMLRNATGSL
ncbi:MAG TPA: acyl-CoA dehydrogenase [Marinobacter hydrocarbonoclasticus]|jgi:acyl-CoA dehydrogenase|uniref:Acyl-CoA dehydrogenase n=1 Tax=Marinobacter nauticus TaxID=2743 RepID=A0A350RVS8_MARNT|nr:MULTISPECIES: acyl-CoA dehydrogenase family protein [Marinobacter]MCG8524283.1 acyl-CoA dehydrogenase family protein [Pseudomonadales bacterium]ERS86780.1 acyl-CoA dehydrogenase [Marinobacter sp. EVN1]KAE8546739.1 Acyl-CoA dehydrogenase [Marinobacter nauticus]MAC22648.1 acyl-CoA dehydrogenase [Marinobacter sp.]MBW3196197.1 acyl-CoA dehydrogenase family protein [Marinobacter nauticus]|tara:strand:+ start:4381 stop:5541 length:1161 start_codon:yes stop_codon:yes gene_type:complete